MAIKRVEIPCKFPDGKESSIKFYIGEAAKGSHPIQFQSQWLGKEYGGKVSKKVMDSLQKLKEIADENRLNFTEICDYVFDELRKNKEINSEIMRSNKQKEIVAQIDNVTKIGQSTNEGNEE